MLISYNFYNSILLQKLINQFVKRGQKEKIEVIIFKFLSQFSRVQNFSALWILLAVIELHKPVLAFQVTKHKNRIVRKPKTRVSQEMLVSVGIRWIKEGIIGDISRVKRKRQAKMLRKQAKELQNKVKTRGFVLTLAEQEVIQNAKLLIFQQRKVVVFRSSIIAYFLTAGKCFSESFGCKQQQQHHAIASESYLYHSYKWN